MWSRAATTLILAYALYHRNRRLATTLLVWLVLDPAAFHPPETTDAWTTRGVLAEREEAGSGQRNDGTGVAEPAQPPERPRMAYLGWAALRRRPAHTVPATALVMGLNLLWIDETIELTGVEPGEPMPAFCAADPRPTERQEIISTRFMRHAPLSPSGARPLRRNGSWVVSVRRPDRHEVDHSVDDRWITDHRHVNQRTVGML